jgi:hypothetical protein
LPEGGVNANVVVAPPLYNANGILTERTLCEFATMCFQFGPTEQELLVSRTVFSGLILWNSPRLRLRPICPGVWKLRTGAGVWTVKIDSSLSDCSWGSAKDIYGVAARSITDCEVVTGELSNVTGVSA